MKNSVKIEEKVKLWLDSKKIHPRQSYNEVLVQMMNKDIEYRPMGMTLTQVMREEK